MMVPPLMMQADHRGADHEEADERAALCAAKDGAQDQGQDRAR